MEIVTMSSRGQLVIPERVRKRHKMREGMRLILLEEGDKLILEKEEALKKLLKKRKDEEEKGWLMLAEQSFKEVWDNEKDDAVWEKYLND